MLHSQFQSSYISTIALIFGLTIASPVNAEIIPDRTLPNNSITVPNCTVCTIEGGTTRGSNLFHSFDRFSVPTLGSAYFNNAPQIQTIFTRVTGNQISTIDGLLRTNGNASLFLMNPNGIVFGPNASLNLGGSFVGTTANAIGFGRSETFSASNPDVPPLLTINPSALIFNPGNQGRIVNRSVTPLGMTAPDGIELYGLQVKPGKGFALIGGDVGILGGGINAPGGRVELGGIVAPGTIGVSREPDGFQFQFPAGVDRADVVLNDEALINVASAGGGIVSINARNVEITEKSSLRGGLETGAIADRPAGDLRINATGVLRMSQLGAIKSILNAGTVGTGGNIIVQADSLAVTSGGQIANVTALSQGKTGNISINVVNTASFDGTDPTEALGSGITSSAAFSLSDSGKINISAGSLFVTGGANFSSSSIITQGSAGDITMNVRDRTVFDGVSNSGTLRSGTTSQNLFGLLGNSGKIRINTGSLSVLNGAQLNTSKSYLTGDSGDIEINARDSVLVSGTSQSGLPSFITTNLGELTVGKAGNIDIKTGSIAVTNGAIINLQTSGLGNSGNLTIDARGQVLFESSGDDPNRRTFISTSAVEGAIGNSGNIIISGDSLLIKNGAALGSINSASGNGGNITLNIFASAVIDGKGSSITSSVFGTKNNIKSGNINIFAKSLQLKNEGILLSSGFFGGSSGNITINAQDTVELSSGAGLSTLIFGQGRAGKVDIRAGNGIALNNTSISAGSFSLEDALIFLRMNGYPLKDIPAIFFQSGQGSANDIEITAPSLRLDNSQISTTTTSGNGGNIQLQLDKLLVLRRESSISTSAGLSLKGAEQGGNGGNINIRIPDGFVVAVASENSDIFANAFSGSGGRVNVTTQGLYGIQFRPRLTPLSDITASSELGVSGVVTLNSLGLDPSNSLVQLPVGLIDPSNKIDRQCSARSSQRSSSFTITGTGGIPASPIETLQQQNALLDLIPLPQEEQATAQPTQSPITMSSHPSLEEAQGWNIDDTGGIWLVASHRSQRSPLNSLDCPGNAVTLGGQS